jgi:ABC-type branched-subunit amino acid transport system substrate-binding protein
VDHHLHRLAGAGGPHLKYVFRPQPYGTQWGLASTAMLMLTIPRSMFGKDPKDLRVAIIHEDGPYGTDVAKGNAEALEEGGLQVVMNEGYSVSSPDLSSLVTKLKRGRPDVICTPATIPTSACSCARRARAGCASMR